MKKILFLGGAQFQTPPIIYANNQKYYTITCDNIAENPGHLLSNKAYNISTVDIEGILDISRKEKIDGILTSGSDISAPTAAIVANELGLPGNHINTINTLVDKALFRKFMNENGFQKTRFSRFDAKQKKKAYDFAISINSSIVIKPVDAAGSKGVSILHNADKLKNALDYAFDHSLSNAIIIEDFIIKKGKQICGDGFMQRGELVFIGFGDGHFYDNDQYLAPWGETFPSTHLGSHLNNAKVKIAKVLKRVGMNNGPFNIDLFITDDGNSFINEIGPRSGGNYIPQATYLNTGVDLIGGAVEIALNNKFQLNNLIKKGNYFFACYMVHSKKDAGRLNNVTFSPEFKEHLLVYHPYLKKGDQITPFHKGSDAIGNAILRFASFEKMKSFYCNIHDHITIKVDS